MANVTLSWGSHRVVIPDAPAVTGWRVTLVDLGTSEDNFEQNVPLTPLTYTFAAVPDGMYEAGVAALDADGFVVGEALTKAIELRDGVLVPPEEPGVDQPFMLTVEVGPDA